jgi:hypothetical protein
LAAAVTVVSCDAATHAVAMMLRPISLEQLAHLSSTIVHGRVEQIASGRDVRGVPATWITVEVARTVKGRARSRFTFKQFGTSEPLADGTIARLPGLPIYHVGEEMVVFLDGESSAGFTSPLGMGQGVFRVHRQGRTTSPTVARDLVAPSEADRPAPSGQGDGDLETFLDEVARLAASGPKGQRR